MNSISEQRVQEQLVSIPAGSMAFNLNGFNFNHSVLDREGHAIRTDTDLLNRANLGLQAMYSPNVHHFPMLLP